MVFSPFQIILAVMTKANPTKKREHLLKFLSKKCSLHSKCYIVFYPVNYSYCVTILQIDTKNCCQFVVNSDLGCRKPLILLGFLVQRLHCGDSDRNPELSGIIKHLRAFRNNKTTQIKSYRELSRIPVCLYWCNFWCKV